MSYVITAIFLYFPVALLGASALGNLMKERA